MNKQQLVFRIKNIIFLQSYPKHYELSTKVILCRQYKDGKSISLKKERRNKFSVIFPNKIALRIEKTK